MEIKITLAGMTFVAQINVPPVINEGDRHDCAVNAPDLPERTNGIMSFIRRVEMGLNDNAADDNASNIVAQNSMDGEEYLIAKDTGTGVTIIIML